MASFNADASILSTGNMAEFITGDIEFALPTISNGQVQQMDNGLPVSQISRANGLAQNNHNRENVEFKEPSEITVLSKSTLELQDKCDSCAIYKKKLNVSRGWNRFFKEKLINIDKVLHIITEFEKEKSKNLELQLAYDQRSREWTQQQEQLIGLLHEIQPLRESLKLAKETAEEEKKERMKHQCVEESLKVTIQQLQAKVSQMHSIANPSFVESLEKKLTTSRSENKKLRCDLEFSKSEIEELRSYISSKHNQLDRLFKKYYWSLNLAKKFGEMIAERGTENTVGWDTLQDEIAETHQSLQTQYSSFRAIKREKLRGKRLELSCIPSFDNWINKDFVDESGKNPLLQEVPEDAELNPKENPSEGISSCDSESEGNHLEKLIAGVDDENVFKKLSDKAKNRKKRRAKTSGKSPANKNNSNKTVNNIKTTEKMGEKDERAENSGSKSANSGLKVENSCEIGSLKEEYITKVEEEISPYSSKKKHISRYKEQVQTSDSDDNISDDNGSVDNLNESTSSAIMLKELLNKSIDTPAKGMPSLLHDSSTPNTKKSPKIRSFAQNSSTPSTCTFATVISMKLLCY